MAMLAIVNENATYYCPTDDEWTALLMVKENCELEGEIEDISEDESGDWTIGETKVELFYLDEFQQV